MQGLFSCGTGPIVSDRLLVDVISVSGSLVRVHMSSVVFASVTLVH